MTSFARAVASYTDTDLRLQSPYGHGLSFGLRLPLLSVPTRYRAGPAVLLTSPRYSCLAASRIGAITSRISE
jgi:hypothetical protein